MKVENIATHAIACFSSILPSSIYIFNIPISQLVAHPSVDKSTLVYHHLYHENQVLICDNFNH